MLVFVFSLDLSKREGRKGRKKCVQYANEARGSNPESLTWWARVSSCTLWSLLWQVKAFFRPENFQLFSWFQLFLLLKFTHFLLFSAQFELFYLDFKPFFSFFEHFQCFWQKDIFRSAFSISWGACAITTCDAFGDSVRLLRARIKVVKWGARRVFSFHHQER